MKAVIFETQNTKEPLNYDKLFSRFAVIRSETDKKQILKHFKQPTITKDKELVSYAIKLENLFKTK